MSINKNIFIHDSDKAALQALKAIPGFTQVLRAFMKVWDEENMHIRNMAQKVRISEEQLPEYYNMLPPICDKLGIEVPELYLELDPYANAYTTGDTKAALKLFYIQVDTRMIIDLISKLIYCSIYFLDMCICRCLIAKILHSNIRRIISA